MTSVLCPPLTFQGVGFGGEPLPFGYLYSYIAGTATPQATWTDSTQVQQNLNPVKLNVNGQAPVWLDPTLTYKFKLTDALGNQVYTTDQVQGSLTAAALSVLLTQSLIGGILYPPIAAEGISVVQPWFPYACIDRYVVNETPGTTPITVGIRAALNAFNYCTFGEGPYLWDSTIALAGNQSLIGLSGGAISAFLTSVVHSALSSGPMISATTTDFGSVYVGNFDISGGNGSYCIVSTRPQSLYENLHMEGASGYNGSGVQLSAASQGSWEVTLRNIKYVASNSAGSPVANAFRGFQVSVNGGNTRLDHCNATYSSVGAEILQGQCITLTHCDFNSCGVNASDSASAGQCGIRLGGTSYKQAISIFECWLEGCVTSIWLETCNNVDIKDCFFDDLGNTNTPAIYLASAAAQNVKIDTNWIQVRNSNSTLACISNAGTSTIITNNTFNASNAGGAQYTIINTVPCVLLNNQNASTNHGTLLDSSGLIQDITPVSGSWTPTLAGSATAGTQTYSLNTGYYWMIGRRVFFDFVIIMTAKDGATAGNLQINGLPIVCRNNAAGRIYSAVIAEHSNLTFVAGSQIGGTLNNNASSITLFQSATGGAVAALTAAALNSTTAVYGSGSYDT